MAAKKSKAAKKSAAPEGVGLFLDTDTILTLLKAVEALSELANAIATSSDAPEIRGSAKKSPAKKSAKKSAKKTAKKSAK